MSRPVIELDLIMAGSASTGAYSAGALDFIIQALACLEAAQRENPDGTPGPAIRLKPHGIAPAGAINAALAANCSSADSRSSLHETWVKKLEMRDALGVAKDKKSSVGALRLFDPDCLGKMAFTNLAAAPEPSSNIEHTVTLVIDPDRDAMPFPTRNVSRGAAQLFLGLQAAAPAQRHDASFWISPTRTSRPGVSSLPALTATLLDGFGGYLDAQFRDHDFQLGRRNAQRALQRYFTAPSDDPLVADWTATFDRDHGVWPIGVAPIGSAPQRPFIPLTGEARKPCPLPPWPQLESRQLRKLEPLLAVRIGHVASEAAQQFLGDSAWTPLAKLMISGRKRKLARETRMALEEILSGTGQLAPPRKRTLKDWFSRSP